MDTQPNICLPSESKHLVNKWKSQASINYHVNYCAHSDPTAGALFTPIPYFYIFFRYLIRFLNYLKQNWKLLRRHLFQNICMNLSDSHLRLKSTTFKKKYEILDQVSTKSALRCCMHSKIRTNIQVHLESGCFGNISTPRFVPSSDLEENNIKAPFTLGRFSPVVPCI